MKDICECLDVIKIIGDLGNRCRGKDLMEKLLNSGVLLDNWKLIELYNSLNIAESTGYLKVWKGINEKSEDDFIYILTSKGIEKYNYSKCIKN